MDYFNQLMRLLEQLWILAVEEFCDLLVRRRALIALLVYVLVVAALVAGIGWLESRFLVELSQLGDVRAAQRLLRDQFYQLGLGNEYDLLMLLGKLPGPIVIVHIFSLCWYPTLVSFISCDLVATDIYRGTLRFLFSRIGRNTYYFSKFIAHTFFYLVLQIGTLLAVFFMSACVAKDFNWWTYFAASWLYLAVFSAYLLFLLALTQCVSCLTAKPARVVLKIHIIWLVFIILAWLVPSASPFQDDIVLGLIAPFKGYGIRAVALICLWAMGFTCLGLFALRRRAV